MTGIRYGDAGAPSSGDFVPGVSCAAPAPSWHAVTSDTEMTPFAMQKAPQQWPPHQTAHASPGAALARPEPRNSVTDEDFREHLAKLGAPNEEFQPQEHSVGRPRDCELVAPKKKDYAAEDFEGAQRYYKKYQNAWKRFQSAKSRLGEASAQDKGRLQKLTLKNAKLLKDTKEDYLSFNRTGLPLKSGTSPEERQKRLISLRETLEDSRQKITETEKSLAEGKVTPEEAAASLQRQNHWKSKTEGEIADIDFEIQNEHILTPWGQLTTGNTDADKIPPAHTGLSLQEYAKIVLAIIDPALLAGGNGIQEVPNTEIRPEHLTISPDAAHLGQDGAPAAMDFGPSSLIPEECYQRGYPAVSCEQQTQLMDSALAD